MLLPNRVGEMFGRSRRSDEVVGFALSGGGARTAAQVGALRALIEGGIRPEIIAGSSAGAVNAAWYALNPDRLDRLESIWLGLRQKDIFPGSSLRVLYNLARHGYVHQAHGWEAFLRRQIGGARFEDAEVQCAAVAVRLSDGMVTVFDTGKMVPAVMASTAIPGVFPPYRIDGELYVDGGVLEFLPIATLFERGATTVYALDCSSFLTEENDGSVVDRCARIGASASVTYALTLHVTRGKVVHHLRPELPALVDARQFSQSARLIEIGYDHARRFLESRSRKGAGGARSG